MIYEGTTFQFGWEVALMEWLQNHIPTALINVFGAFSAFGEEMVLILIMGFLYWCWNKEYGRRVGVVTCVGFVFNPMIKNVIFRRRPYFDNPGIKCLRPVDSGADLYDIGAQGYSFPSGHSTNGAGTYFALSFFAEKHKKGLAIVAGIITFLIGFSRVVVGCHYPTDVLCGWLLGLVDIGIVGLLYKKIDNHLILGLILAGIGAIGMFYCQTNDYFAGYGILMGVLLSEPFEKKFVNFEPTRKPFAIALRIIGGGAIYLALNTLFKMPFSKEFLGAPTFLAHFVRFLRYGIILFIDTAIYPMVFKFKPFK